jgi:hypothetical protein
MSADEVRHTVDDSIVVHQQAANLAAAPPLQDSIATSFRLLDGKCVQAYIRYPDGFEDTGCLSTNSLLEAGFISANWDGSLFSVNLETAEFYQFADRLWGDGVFDGRYKPHKVSSSVPVLNQSHVPQPEILRAEKKHRDVKRPPGIGGLEHAGNRRCQVCYHEGISLAAKLVYAEVMNSTHSGDNEFWQSVRTTAALLKMDKTTATRAYAELAEVGLLVSTGRKHHSGSNIYQPVKHDEWAETVENSPCLPSQSEEAENRRLGAVNFAGVKDA